MRNLFGLQQQFIRYAFTAVTRGNRQPVHHHSGFVYIPVCHCILWFLLGSNEKGNAPLCRHLRLQPKARLAPYRFQKPRHLG